MNPMETIDIKRSDNYLLQLTNNIQQELMFEAGVPQENSNQEAFEWIMSNASKFRIEFERLWQEIAQDKNYTELISLFENGDIEPIKKSLLPLIRERMKQ